MLRTHHLTIGYVERPLARNLNLAVEPGRLHCLLGPNGVGKSTLIRTLVGMQQPLNGDVYLNGNTIHTMDARERAKQLAVVLTDRVSVSSLTVYELVALGRHPHTGWFGQLHENDTRIIDNALQAVGAVEIAQQSISAISDGQRQKALIARALAQQPTVLILDEPTAYLDVPHRVEVMRILQQLAHQQGCAVLLSTHDLDLALRHADRVWLMAPHADGATIRMGTPEDLVLQGAFQATFDRSGIIFDVKSGAFHIAQQPGQVITVEGDAPYAYWTKRALTRVGYHLIPDAPLRVYVSSEGWQLHQPDQSPQSIDSIETLLMLLSDV